MKHATNGSFLYESPVCDYLQVNSVVSIYAMLSQLSETGHTFRGEARSAPYLVKQRETSNSQSL